MIEDGLPKWIPGSFGNKKHSSLALSPSPPRARSAGRPALSNSLRSTSTSEVRREANMVNSCAKTIPKTTPANYDILASRAAPQRSSSAANPRVRSRDPPQAAQALQAPSPSIWSSSRNEPHMFQQETPNRSYVRTPQAASRRSQTHRNNAHQQEAETGAASSTLDPTQQLLFKSMSNMTVAEIRAALMSMPPVVRHSLVDSNSPKHTHQQSHSHSHRRATYQSDNGSSSPDFPAGTANDTNNSSSMHEYYDENGRQERFEQFSGEQYPAVGEFFPEDHHLSSAPRGDGRQRDRRVQRSAPNDRRHQPQGYERGRQHHQGQQSQDQDQSQTQNGEEEYSGAEESSRSGSGEDVPDYEYEYEQQEPAGYTRREGREGGGGGAEFSAEEGYEEELEHCGEYDYGGFHPQSRRSDREVTAQERSRRAAGASGGQMLSTPAEYSTADEGSTALRRPSSKPQLPAAARRSSVSGGSAPSAGRTHSPHHPDSHGYHAQREGTTSRAGRESSIPRPVESSPRSTQQAPSARRRRNREDSEGDTDNGNVRRSQHHREAQQPRQHQQPHRRQAQPQPAWGYRNQDGRARSAQRASGRSSQSQPDDPYAEQDQRATSAGTSERVRYLPEQQRKETLEWSRKQAAEKKLRSNFSASPVRAVSPGVTPAIKLKYRSFNNSVEKEFATTREESASEAEQGHARGPASQHGRDGDSCSHNGTGRALDVQAAAAMSHHRALSASRSSNAPTHAEAPSGGNNSGGGGRGRQSKSPMFRAFDKTPSSFFEFRSGGRAVINPRQRQQQEVAAQDPGEHSSPAATDRQVSPPLKGRSTAGPASTPTDTDTFIRSNTQLLANYQHARRPPGRDKDGGEAQRRPNPAAAHPVRGLPAGASGVASSTITNVAEWRRLTDWLTRTGMERYVDVLRVNGITKLSMVELMEPEDMRQIGIATADIPLFQNNVSEFTNRTRSFSEQVLGRTEYTPPSSPPNVPHAVGTSAARNENNSNNFISSSSTRPGVPVPAPATAPFAAGVTKTTPSMVPPSGQRVLPSASLQSAQISTSSSLHENENVPLHHSQTETGKPRSIAVSVAANQSATAALHSGGDLLQQIDGSDNDALLATDSVIGANEHIFSDVNAIRNELHRCFDCGERELFFHAWKQLVLYMPEDCITLNPLHPAFYHAKQVIEFNLHLHFAVYPITHHMGKRAEKAGKLALKRYFESMMLTSEMDALNKAASDQPPGLSSFSADATAGGVDASKLNSSSYYSTSPTQAVPSFTRSREYATYAGIVLVPEPQENIAFQTLFQADWMESLKARLEQFLQLVSPNVEIVPTASSSIIAAAAEAEAVESAEAQLRLSDAAAASAQQQEQVSGDSASVRSAREKVRSFLHVKEPAGVPKGTLNDFEITFSSPTAPQNEENNRASPPISAIRGCALGPASPTELDMTTKLEQDVVSPLAMSPPADEHKRYINTKLPEDGGAVTRISRIASPASPVSSIISQLTDDSHRPGGSGALTVAAESTAANSATTASSKKPKLKPYGSATKKAMQSQVDMYNKLLKKSRSPSLEPNNDNVPLQAAPTSTDEPQQQPEESQAPPQSPERHIHSHNAPACTGIEESPIATRRASTSGGPYASKIGNKASSLNVGFGMKRKTHSALLPAPDQSLAAQVARYNRLLVKSTDSGDLLQDRAATTVFPEPTAAAATAAAFTSNNNGTAAEVEENLDIVEENEDPAKLLRSTTGGSGDIGGAGSAEESKLSPAEAQQVQDALLEIQKIYLAGEGGVDVVVVDEPSQVLKTEVAVEAEVVESAKVPLSTSEISTLDAPTPLVQESSDVEAVVE